MQDTSKILPNIRKSTNNSILREPSEEDELDQQNQNSVKDDTSTIKHKILDDQDH